MIKIVDKIVMIIDLSIIINNYFERNDDSFSSWESSPSELPSLCITGMFEFLTGNGLSSFISILPKVATIDLAADCDCDELLTSSSKIKKFVLISSPMIKKFLITLSCTIKKFSLTLSYTTTKFLLTSSSTIEIFQHHHL